MTIKHDFEPQVIDAIRELNPSTQVSTMADGSIVFHDGNPTNITQSQIDTKLAELRTEYDNLAYARERARKYPKLKEFAEAYTEKEIGGDSTKWDAYVVKYNQVRNDNPKD